jgi:transcriptional regulator with XRE-family HTH domain
VTVGDRLREERERLCLNQTDFAQKGSVTRRSQSHYETGKRSPDAEYLAAISEIGVDVLYVLTGKRAVKNDESAKEVHETQKIEQLPVDAEALAGVIEGVETALANRRLRLAPDKKAQVVTALYEYFKATGQPNAAAVERYLNLAS